MPLITFPHFSENTDNTKNVGGMCYKITLIPVEQVRSETSTTIVANTAYEFYYTPKTAVHLENEKKNTQGSIFEQKINFVVPKLRTDILEFCVNNHERYFICIVKDANDFTREVGSIKKPMQFFYTATTGREPKDRNQFSFSLEGNLLKPAPQARIFSVFVPEYGLRFDGLGDFVSFPAPLALTANAAMSIYIDYITYDSTRFADFITQTDTSIIRRDFLVNSMGNDVLRLNNSGQGLVYNTLLTTVTEQQSSARVKTLFTKQSNTGTATLYVNGSLKNSGVFNAVTQLTSTPVLRFGALPSSPSYFWGVVRRVMIFNRELTALEAVNPEIVTSGLIMHLDFNQITGLTVPDLVAGNNGTILGQATADLVQYN